MHRVGLLVLSFLEASHEYTASALGLLLPEHARFLLQHSVSHAVALPLATSGSHETDPDSVELK